MSHGNEVFGIKKGSGRGDCGSGADGLQAEAVAKIFAAKGRPADNPLILHIADPEQIHALTTGLNANARALMETFWPGPLTIVVPRSSVVPDIVTAGLDTVAVRMPSHPVAAALIRAAGCPIAAPSANVSGKPSPTNAKDVAEDMTGKVAAILDGGSCGIGVESSVWNRRWWIPRPRCPPFCGPGGSPGKCWRIGWGLWRSIRLSTAIRPCVPGRRE